MTITQQVTDWIEAVVSGEELRGRWVRLACIRQQMDLERIGSDDFPWVFDANAAAGAIEFFPLFLKHSKGEFAGQPFELSPDQKFILWCIMGWRHRDTGYRRFLRAFISVARKFGKSTYAAGIACLLLFFDTPIESDAEGYIAATKEDQACIVHTQAVKMIEANPHLKSRVRVFKNRDKYKSIVLPDPPYNGSTFKPVGSDSNTSDGLNPHFVIKDELHAWKQHHKGLKDRLETGGGARRQPLDLTISTNGTEESLFYIQEDNACTAILEAVERGEFIADRQFAYLARLDEERPCECGGGCASCVDGIVPADDPFDEDNWIKANPNIGISPKWSFMRDQAERAQRDPAFKNSFLQFHCNVQVDSKSTFINPATWVRAAVDEIDWESADAVCGAFDFGWRDDLSAFGICGRWDDENGHSRYAFQCRSYICENASRNLLDEPWAAWLDAGWLIKTDGNTTDFDRFRDDLLEWAERFNCSQWRFDPANARQFGSELQNKYGLMPVEFPQNHKQYHEPFVDLKAQIVEQNVQHLPDPVLAWQIGNVVARQNYNGLIMPDKLKSKDKIDAVAVLIMAFSGVRPATPEAPQVSNFYENNGLEIIG